MNTKRVKDEITVGALYRPTIRKSLDSYILVDRLDITYTETKYLFKSSFIIEGSINDVESVMVTFKGHFGV